MDRRQIALKLTLDALGLPFEIDSFTDRLILQKAVYLAQEKGVHLGYYYSWYLYGPYAPTLTRDVYDIKSELDEDFDESQGWELDEDSQQRLKPLAQLLAKYRDRSQLARKLELLASVHFIVKRKQVRDNSPHAIEEKLKAFNKDFTKEEIAEALKELENYGLLSGGGRRQNNR